MVARSDTPQGKQDLWKDLAEPISRADIKWLKKSNTKKGRSDNKFWALFVPYIEVETVRTRLDTVVPGEWDLTLEPMNPIGAENEKDPDLIAFKARLAILGVIREDVGQGKDYKQASTDAFKRVAMRFGIGSNLGVPNIYVEMKGDGKYDPPVESFEDALARAERRASRPPAQRQQQQQSAAESKEQKPAAAKPAPQSQQGRAPILDWKTAEVTDSPATIKARIEVKDLASVRFRYHGKTECFPACPTCQGQMYDNRHKKRPYGTWSPKSPDFTCMDKVCADVKGKYWTDEFQSAFARGTVQAMFIKTEDGPAIFYPEDRVEDIAEASRRARDGDDLFEGLQGGPDEPGGYDTPPGEDDDIPF